METYAITRRGLKRGENQDRFWVRKFDDRSLLMAVADGMGGEAGGGQAAQIAIEAIKYFNPDCPAIGPYFKKLFRAASKRIKEEAQKDSNLNGMGSTLTASYIKTGVAHWAHVGDSRIYLFRKDTLTQITEDQTFVNTLWKEGSITAEEAVVHPMKNILLQCVGCGPLKITTGKFKVGTGDFVLLSTDGLYQQVEKDKMAFILALKISIKEKFKRLIHAALHGGGRDDITIAGVKI